MAKISLDNNMVLSNLYQESRGTDRACKLVGDHLISDIAKGLSHYGCIQKRTNTAGASVIKIVGIQ